jgi:5'-phosphate synthase pdxT subunit
VGVLALQGDFQEHVQVVSHLGAQTREVRLPQELEEVQALILPGGESTSMVRLLDLHGLREPVCRRIREGMPAWGTCAGLILLAREIREKNPAPLGLMDVQVARNAYGRQADSFETDVSFPALGEKPFHAVFIRAPAIVGCGPGVEVLARLDDGTPVAARQGNILVTAFHPELTPDMRLHSYFLAMAGMSDDR